MKLNKTIKIDCNTILEEQSRRNKLTLVTKIWKDVSDSYLFLQEAKKALKIEILETEKSQDFEQIKYIANLFHKYRKPKSTEFSETRNYVTRSKNYQEWKTKLIEESKIIIQNAVMETIVLNNIMDFYKRQEE